MRNTHRVAFFCLHVLAFSGADATKLAAQRSAGAIASNQYVVDQWAHAALLGDWQAATPLLADVHTLHDATGTTQVSREARLEQLAAEWQTKRGIAVRQIEVFGDQDKICLLYAADTEDGPVSAVEFHRVADGRIVESWRSFTATGVAWMWNPEAVGDLEGAANRRVLQRWYDDMWAKGDWRSVPELAGPTFQRHEDREFEMSADQYAERVRTALDVMGPLQFDYDVITGRDKVSVIGHGPNGGLFLQAWRVREGKLVESWWVPR